MRKLLAFICVVFLLAFSCVKAPEEVAVSSISLGQTLAEMIIGETVQLTATVLPSNATDKTIIWASSKPSVATISNSGLITAISEGSSTITVSAGGKSATCIVTVSKGFVAVNSVSLNISELVLDKGQSETLTATVNPDDATDKTVTWSSSDTKIVTVDSNGKVTAVAGGTATITAKASDKQATCTVTVSVPVESVVIDKESISLEEGSSSTLVATVKPDDATDKSVSWSSSNTSIAAVDQNGKVTAVKEGKATITAKAGSQKATCIVTVQKKAIAVASISLNKTSLSLVKGHSETLTATVKPDDATDKTVTWGSSNTKIVTVDSNGKVTAVAGGTATITAKAGDKQATCTVTVSVPVESVVIDKESISLEEGSSSTLVATVKPDDATDKSVSWSSSNTSIATVDQNGKVTAVKEGKATITVKAGEKTATCLVTVKKRDPLVLSATSLNADCLNGATVSVQVEAGSVWTVKETGNSILNLSKESGNAGVETLTITFDGANCTNSERTSTLMFECDGVTKYLEVNQLSAFHFDSLNHIIPSSGGSYQLSFQYAKNNSSRSMYISGDDGYNNLRNSSGFDDNASPLALIDFASTAGPVMTSFHTSLSFKPNYSKNSRTGRFRVYFEEDGQRLYSEWISVTQLPDENAGEESDGVSTVLRQHTKGSGVPVVILGDGFTKSDIDNGTFAKAAGLAYESFFSVEPLTSLQEYFDVWSITAVSASRTFNGSGTRFGCMNTGGTRIEGNNELVYHYATKVVPSNKLKDMLIIVVLNTNIYAGTCVNFYLTSSDETTFTYSIAYTPMTNSNGITMENVIHHEACGHGMGKLADEYSGSSAITSSAKANLLKFHDAGGYVNVDVYSDVSQTLWAQYAEDERFSYECIGAYQGGYTYKSGVYRPTQTSIMNDNVGIFNAPSRAQIYRRVMSIAHDWNWTFNYETFVSFDASFRQRNYSSSSMQALDRQSRAGFIPLASPVLIEDDESKYF